MKKPIIGVTPLFDQERDSYWMLPGYLEGLEQAGAIPVVLPLPEESDDLTQLISLCDGLLFTGGQDVSPALYGETPKGTCGEICSARDRMEQVLLHLALERDLPVLGICRGIQFLNAALGGAKHVTPVDVSEAAVAMAQENARTECERMTTKAERTASVLRLLAEKLGLPEPPGRIEAYDISNTGASDIVAAMTVFADGKPKKSAYRYFLLRDLDGPDDYASMDQVISRRFKREIDGDERFARHPDLLLIDGGQTHAAVARRAMEQYGLDIPTFGMVKDDRHRTRALVTPEGREIGIQGAPALFAFIGQIQEETHRFAITYHHQHHTKSAMRSALDGVPGLGPKRQAELRKHFGTVKAIREADETALAAVLPQNVAHTLWIRLHEKEST